MHAISWLFKQQTHILSLAQITEEMISTFDQSIIKSLSGHTDFTSQQKEYSTARSLTNYGPHAHLDIFSGILCSFFSIYRSCLTHLHTKFQKIPRSYILFSSLIMISILSFSQKRDCVIVSLLFLLTKVFHKQRWTISQSFLCSWKLWHELSLEDSWLDYISLKNLQHSVLFILFLPPLCSVILEIVSLFPELSLKLFSSSYVSPLK